jgi:acyl dehydratase
MMAEWFDDLVLGMRVTREEIKRFASEFDPQPYHLDEAAAECSVFGALAASGWHTAARSGIADRRATPRQQDRAVVLHFQRRGGVPAGRERV